ncbi:hypothetical protein GCM10010387_53450 [Streptomyces inusitatus]|uniref:Sortase n=1 Tax=Streptomyces inusitatus TaxID=68221 RepID=A0A918V195_9ACTN|nr:hypothetical protein [Streptomyces inusitatus]GGZ52485.1 hypothetical protein GCM10010387_53450 [Streptomyces inusitatus]
MRSRSIALSAAGVAVALVMAPAAAGAHARDSVTVTVHPAEVRPGDEIEIRVRGCEAREGTARSGVFASDARLGGGGGGGDRRSEDEEERHGSGQESRTLSGSTSLAFHAKPGAHDITVACDGRHHRAAGVLRVAGGHLRPGEPTPVAPVRAGGGGTAALAADARHQDESRSAGPGTTHTVVGLVLTAVAALAVAFRSSRRRRTGPR